MRLQDLRHINALALGILEAEDGPQTDVGAVIKELITTSWAGSNDEQAKAIELLKGLAFSEDPRAKKFMAALEKATNSMDVGEFEEATWVGNPKRP